MWGRQELILPLQVESQPIQPPVEERRSESTTRRGVRCDGPGAGSGPAEEADRQSPRRLLFTGIFRSWSCVTLVKVHSNLKNSQALNLLHYVQYVFVRKELESRVRSMEYRLGLRFVFEFKVLKCVGLIRKCRANCQSGFGKKSKRK